MSTVSTPKLPTLRAALRLYLLVVIATVLIIVGLVGIDITFLRLAAAVFVAVGFTFGALLLTGISIGTVFGKPPKLILLGAGFLGGVAVWIPATWLLGLTQQALLVLFGSLPAPIGSTVSEIGQGIVFGVILPLCQGFLFFGYLHRAAQGIGRWRGVWLVAVLYGVYGLISAGLGLSALPGYFLVGLIGAALTARSGSALVGIAALSGFFLGDPILRDFVILGLGTTDTLTVGWLTAVLLSAFIAFVIVQAARLFAPAHEPNQSVPPGRLWWIELLIVLVIALTLIYGEAITRSLRPYNRPAQPTSTGSTAPPALPTVPITPAAPTRAP